MNKAQKEQKEYAARVVAAEDVAPGMRILHVEIDNRQRLNFRAGQYVMMSAGGHPPRAFSIASAPDEPLLEIHVRNSGHGVSAYAAEEMKPGSALTLSGPYGENVWQGSLPRPLLMLAGGIGIAPMKAMIHAHLAARASAPVWLYWGVRDRGQLYLDEAFRALAAKHPRFSYIPVLSDAEDGAYRHGFIGPAVAADFDTLAGYSIYMAGPKAMIDATLPLLEQNGAEMDYVFCDAFSV